MMSAAQFSLPRQWEDWCNWLLGIWLCISPWALQFDLDSTSTQTAVILGVLIILAELVTLSVYRAWEEWVSVILGAWLIICSWILGISSSAARATFVVVGLLVITLAFYEIWEARRQSSNQN
jgi:membrane-bound ClpP family serine protease